jgi:serine/threonine-protein phosphatase 5
MPTDKDAREKYDITLKEFKYRELAKCLGYDESKVNINIEDIIVEPSYNGPRLDNGVDDINQEWVVKLMDYMKDGKVLHKKYASMIIMKCREIFDKD